MDQTWKASGRTIGASLIAIWKTGFSRLRWPVSPSARKPHPVGQLLPPRSARNRKEEAQVRCWMLI